MSKQTLLIALFYFLFAAPEIFAQVSEYRGQTASGAYYKIVAPQAWQAEDGSVHMTGAGRSYMEIKQEHAEAASSSSGGWGGGSSMGATESNSSSVSAGPRSDNTVFRSL